MEQYIGRIVLGSLSDYEAFFNWELILKKIFLELI